MLLACCASNFAKLAQTLTCFVLCRSDQQRVRAFPIYPFSTSKSMQAFQTFSGMSRAIKGYCYPAATDPSLDAPLFCEALRPIANEKIARARSSSPRAPSNSAYMTHASLFCQNRSTYFSKIFLQRSTSPSCISSSAYALNILGLGHLPMEFPNTFLAFVRSCCLTRNMAYYIQSFAKVNSA